MDFIGRGTIRLHLHDLRQGYTPIEQPNGPWILKEISQGLILNAIGKTCEPGLVINHPPVMMLRDRKLVKVTLESSPKEPWKLIAVPRDAPLSDA